MIRNDLCGGWKPEKHFKARDSVKSAENEYFGGTQMSKYEV